MTRAESIVHRLSNFKPCCFVASTSAYASGFHSSVSARDMVQ